MEFRLAVMDDLPQLKRVFTKIVAHMDQNDIRIWDEIYPCAFFQDDIVNRRLYIVTEKRDILGAFALCGSNAGEKHVKWKNGQGRALYLERFGVNPDYLRRGIGGAMLFHAAVQAKEQGAEFLRLFVVDINRPAISLYEKNGFQKAEGVYDEAIDEALVLHELGYEKKLEDHIGLLHDFTEMSRTVLGGNLAGIYLHGSAAMGCFNPAKSDLDLILVVKNDIPDAQKLAFMEEVVRFQEHAPAKGLELSVVKREFCRPFAYPTPFELHFSPMHLNWFLKNPQEYVRRMKGTDRDLAAHFTIIRRYGKVLYGAGIEEIFGEVSGEDYLDSIKADIENAREDIVTEPVYVILNLCRVLAYLREELVLSKKDGGAWSMERLPQELGTLVRDALQSYESDEEMAVEPEAAVRFADYMLKQIAEAERADRNEA